MKEISIVIPVFNSEDNLIELNRQIQEALKDISFEIILVNDCSKDKSWNVIKQLSLENDNITGINFRKNFGQDNALMAGFTHASGKYIAIMDDDLQHSPYDIIKLYDEITKGFDICYAHFFEKNQNLLKNFGSWLNGSLASVLLQKPRKIYMSPFKMVNKEIIQEILLYNGPFPYVDGLLLETTQQVTSIEIEHYKRFKGKSNYNFIRSISVFLKTLTGFSVIPLRLATYTGFTISLIGFLVALYYIVEYFRINETVEGWTSIILSVLITGGLLLMFMGLIGEYLGRMFLTLNKKPQYSIKEIIKK